MYYHHFYIIAFLHFFCLKNITTPPSQEYSLFLQKIYHIFFIENLNQSLKKHQHVEVQFENVEFQFENPSSGKKNQVGPLESIVLKPLIARIPLTILNDRKNTWCAEFYLLPMSPSVLCSRPLDFYFILLGDSKSTNDLGGMGRGATWGLLTLFLALSGQDL